MSTITTVIAITAARFPRFQSLELFRTLNILRLSGKHQNPRLCRWLLSRDHHRCPILRTQTVCVSCEPTTSDRTSVTRSITF